MCLISCEDFLSCGRLQSHEAARSLGHLFVIDRPELSAKLCREEMRRVMGVPCLLFGLKGKPKENRVQFFLGGSPCYTPRKGLEKGYVKVYIKVVW